MATPYTKKLSISDYNSQKLQKQKYACIQDAKAYMTLKLSYIVI